MVSESRHRFAAKQLEDLAAKASGGDPRSLFVGWGSETAASLVSHLAVSDVHLVPTAWRALVATASVDGVLHASELSSWGKENREEAEEWREQFFAQPQCLEEWLLAEGWQNAPAATPTALRFAIVLTTSPLQIDLGRLLEARLPAFRSVVVDALTSESDLSHKLEDFNDAGLPPGAVLVLQLRADSPHVELLRHRCGELRKDCRALLLLHGSRRLLRPLKIGQGGPVAHMILTPINRSIYILHLSTYRHTI